MRRARASRDRVAQEQRSRAASARRAWLACMARGRLARVSPTPRAPSAIEHLEGPRSEPRDPLLERVLVHGPRAVDGELSARGLERSGLWAEACPTIERLCEAIDDGAAIAVVADEALCPQARRRLAAVLAAQPKWSDLPVVLCTTRDDARRTHALRSLSPDHLGNVLLIEAPMREHTVLAAVHSGLRARRRQVDLRDLFIELERAKGERTELVERERIARAEAEEAKRAKDEFLGMISHELRTPLNAILGWSRMMAAGRLADAQRHRAVVTIERNAVAQAKLIDELLDVSWLVSGKLKLSMRSVDLRSIVESSATSLRVAAETKGLVLTVALAEEPVVMLGDAERLAQIVSNLIGNAIKFTPAGGRVDVALSTDEATGSARVSVRDDGIGIRDQFLAFVFDRFRQADGSRTREHGGLGLGLAIVRHLVELHGGDVSATSAGAGGGAEFVVTMPLRASS